MSAVTNKVEAVIRALGKLEQATAKQLDTTSTYLAGLVESKLIQVKGTVKTGARPANVYTLTRKGKSLHAKLTA